MEIINKFGLDPILLVAQIVNFLIVFFILKKYLYKPILEMIDKRKTTIQEGVKQAEESKILLEKAFERERKLLKNAQDEGKKILERSKKQAETFLEDSRKDAEQQTTKMIKEARNQIQTETKTAEKQLATYISKLAIDFLEKSVGDLFTEKDQKEVMQKALKQLKKRSD